MAKTVQSETSIVDALHNYWRKGYKGPNNAWTCFSDFYHWALDHGYGVGSWIATRDKRKPIGPDNCIIKNQYVQKDMLESIIDYDKACAKLWKALGLDDPREADRAI